MNNSNYVGSHLNYDDNLFLKNFEKSNFTQHFKKGIGKPQRIHKQQSQNFFGENTAELLRMKKNNPFNARKTSSNLGNLSVNEEIIEENTNTKAAAASGKAQQLRLSPTGINRYKNQFGVGGASINTSRGEPNQQYIDNKKNYKKHIQSVNEPDDYESPPNRIRDGNIFLQNKGSQIQLKQDSMLKKIRQRATKNLPKHYFLLKRNDPSIIQQYNAQQLFSYDYSITDLQLIGSQFQSKPPDLSPFIEKKKYNIEGGNIDHRELLQFLKQKYSEQQDFLNNKNSFVQGNEIRQKHFDINNFQPQLLKEKVSTLDVSLNESKAIENRVSEKSLLFPQTQMNRHRKLMSQVNSKKNATVQPPRIIQSRTKAHQMTADSKIDQLQVSTSNNINENDKIEGQEHQVAKEQTIPRRQTTLNQRLRTKKSQNANSTHFLISQQKLESEDEKLERMHKLQKQIRAKYNDISISYRQANKDEPYKYIVIRGNNSELIKKCLDDRNGDWQEIQCTNTLFNFKWVPFSKGIRFEYLTSHGQKKMVNHFEFQEQISQKDTLFLNLQKYCENIKQNVFNVIPITFILDFGNKQVFQEIERFQTFFNILEKNKAENDISQLNKVLTSHPLFLNSKYQGSTKYILNKTMFNGKNFWLIKPTDFNRGRGVQVFSTLEQFKKLVNEYQLGVEVKFSQKEQPNQKSAQESQPVIEKQQQGYLPPEQILTNFTNLDNIPNIVKTDSFVIQKYLEGPLLINKRKFDIRLWVLVTHDFKCYLFNEGYIRTSSFEFDMSPASIDKPFIHLTNNAVQKYNESYGLFEEGNQLSFQ